VPETEIQKQELEGDPGQIEQVFMNLVVNAGDRWEAAHRGSS